MVTFYTIHQTVLLFKRLGKAIPNPSSISAKGVKTEVDVETVRKELAQRAEKKAKDEKERIEKMVSL